MNRSSLALLIAGPLVALAVWFATATLARPSPPDLGDTVVVSSLSGGATTSPNPSAGTATARPPSTLPGSAPRTSATSGPSADRDQAAGRTAVRGTDPTATPRASSGAVAVNGAEVCPAGDDEDDDLDDDDSDDWCDD